MAEQCLPDFPLKLGVLDGGSWCRVTVILGCEQANKYTVLDQDGNTVALLAEDAGGLGKEVGRQFLRTRRSFTATILSPEGKALP